MSEVTEIRPKKPNDVLIMAAVLTVVFTPALIAWLCSAMSVSR